MNGTQMQRMKKIPAWGTNRLGFSHVHAQSSVDMKRCRQRVHELREPTVQVGVVRHHAEIRDLDPGLHAQDNVDGSMTAIATCGQADTLSLSLDFIPALAGDEIRLEHIDVHQRGRCTPRLVRALKLPQARVRCTPRLAPALKLPQARVRCTPRLARTLKLPQARVRCTPRLGLDRHVHVGHDESLEHEMRHVLQDGQGVHKGGLVHFAVKQNPTSTLKSLGLLTMSSSVALLVDASMVKILASASALLMCTTASSEKVHTAIRTDSCQDEMLGQHCTVAYIALEHCLCVCHK